MVSPPTIAPHAAPLDCDRARLALPGLWNGELERDAQRALRAHLRDCGACSEEYRREAQVAASLAHERRLARVRREREVRRRWLTSLGIDQGGARRMWLRTLVLPAFLIVMLARQQPAATFARVAAENGAYSLGEMRLGQTHKPLRLRRGDLICAADDALVRLYDPEAELALHGAGSVLVEAPDARSYWLGPGTFEVRGPHSLTTSWGVIELREGAAAIEVAPHSVRVVLHEGLAELVRASGACELTPRVPFVFGAGL